MKKLYLFAFLLFSILNTYAQEKSLPAQITFAYYGNIINEQGGRISAQFYLKDYYYNEEKLQRYSIFVQPNVAFLSRPLFYSNLQLATDIGIRRQGSQSKYYHALSIGAGYLARMEVVSFTTDFKGEVVAKDRETWDYVMPTIAYEVGKVIVADIGWFVKLNYGLRLPLQESQEQNGMPIFELGMKLPLKSKKE